mmetsp:Transcript_42994/g.101100  ORF Transcript_42994/g.101100 Transcript_42994/m.101100 type:complete len:203 (+) Transcript_42994:658-1266(+)
MRTLGRFGLLLRPVRRFRGGIRLRRLRSSASGSTGSGGGSGALLRKLSASAGGLALGGKVVVLVRPLHHAQLAADLLESGRAHSERLASAMKRHVKHLFEDFEGNHNSGLATAFLTLPSLPARIDDVLAVVAGRNRRVACRRGHLLRLRGRHVVRGVGVGFDVVQISRGPSRSRAAPRRKSRPDKEQGGARRSKNLLLLTDG